MQLPFEQFPALNVLAMCRHIFARRIPGIHVSHDKAEALKRLESAHLEIRNAIGIGDWPLLTAQQIHGDKIACVNAFRKKGVESAHRFKGDRTNARKILDRAPGSYRPAQPVHSSAPLRGRFRCGYHSTMSDGRLERDS